MLQNLSSAAVVIGALRVKINGFSHYYQLDQSISALMVVGMYFAFLWGTTCPITSFSLDVFI